MQSSATLERNGVHTLEEIMQIPTGASSPTMKIKVRITGATPKVSSNTNRACVSLDFDYDGQNPDKITLPSGIEIQPDADDHYQENVAIVEKIRRSILAEIARTAKGEEGKSYYDVVGYCDVVLLVRKIPNYIRAEPSEPLFTLAHVIRKGKDDVELIFPDLYSFDDTSNLERT